MQRKVLWWYILPPAVPMMIFFIHCGLLDGALWRTVHNSTVGILIFWGAYELILRGARKQLEPRRNELRELLESLETEEAGSAGLSETQN